MVKQTTFKSTLIGFLNTLATTCTIISGLSLVVLVFTFGWLVYGRYILNSTPTWVEQLSLLLIITITFLSSASGIHERTHLRVDIIPMLLGPKSRCVLSILASITLCIFGALMAIHGFGLSEFSWSKEIPLLGIPEGVRYIPVFVSGSLVVLFSVGHIAKDLCELLCSENQPKTPAHLVKD